MDSTPPLLYNRNDTRSRKTALPHESLLQPGAAGDPPGELPEYDWEELRRHNSPRDLWLAVGGHVHNVDEFLYHHPGGAEVLLAQHGQDAAAAFLKVAILIMRWR